MDYEQLAEEFISRMVQMQFSDLNRSINEAMRGEHFILAYVYHNDSALPGELAQAMQTSTAYVAKMLRGLEEKDLIRRTLDINDRRRILVTLTEKGKEQAKKDAAYVKDGVKWMLSILDDEDAVALVRILRKLSEKTANIHLS